MEKLVTTRVLDHQQVCDRIIRIAWQIYEHTSDNPDVIIAGIAERGYLLASKLAERLKEISPMQISLHKLSINKKAPLSSEPEIDPETGSLKGKTIILVDDVLNSGETLIYGVRHFLQFELHELKTVVLVDRNHKRFPVKADFKGLSLSTSIMEHVDVHIGSEPYSVTLS